MVDWKMDF